MITLASGLSYLDLQFQGVQRVIATAVLHGTSGVALIDPGPSTAVPTLRETLKTAGIAMEDVTAVLLTHIHLDHAGATGTLVQRWPRIRVYVHEKGAPHMANPEKLLASAARLYGDDMQKLWGEVLPVSPEAINILKGGERITAGGQSLDVEYTPGHASHHVSYFSGDTGIAFVGDTAGIMLRPLGFVLPPTPPPDIDLDVWRQSLASIGRRRPDTLFLTHFGPSTTVAAHLSELDDHLELTSRLVKESLARDESDEAREAWFTEAVRRELRRRTSEADAHAYEVAGRFDLNWRGLARYWRKRTT